MYYMHFTAILLVSALSLFGEIRETYHFRDILKVIQEGDLVVLDIDDTLMVPVQSLGCDVWFRSRLKHWEAVGQSPKEALEKALAEWEGIRHLTKMELVEPDIADVVKKMQDDKYAVIALSTQGLALTTRTYQQLKELGVDMALAAPRKTDDYFINGNEGVLYRKGILSTAGTCKGDALKTWIQRAELPIPKRIVFINDKLSHVKDVEKYTTHDKIDYLGLRYSFSDARVNAFDLRVAELQFEPFKHIMSDEEAKKHVK